MQAVRANTVLQQLKELLREMDKLRHEPRRDEFMADFDLQYMAKTREYKKITGREWVARGE